MMNVLLLKKEAEKTKKKKLGNLFCDPIPLGNQTARARTARHVGLSTTSEFLIYANNDFSKILLDSL